MPGPPCSATGASRQMWSRRNQDFNHVRLSGVATNLWSANSSVVCVSLSQQRYPALSVWMQVMEGKIFAQDAGFGKPLGSGEPEQSHSDCINAFPDVLPKHKLVDENRSNMLRNAKNGRHVLKWILLNHENCNR
eukprot:2481845-Amphidinium_carterae.2